jgi:hypothetical protein
VLIPWSAFWERNYFVEGAPALAAFFNSSYTRGAVTGLGLVNVVAALAELADLFGGRPQPAVGNQQSAINPQSDISNQQ